MTALDKFLMFLFGRLPYRPESLGKCIPVLRERLYKIGYHSPGSLSDAVYTRLLHEAYARTLRRSEDGVVRQREFFEEIDRIADGILNIERNTEGYSDHRLASIIELDK